MDLCQYKDLFGKPREGSHKYRIPFIDLALVDIALTVLAGFLAVKFTEFSPISVFIFLLILAIVSHKIFCVDTALNVALFGPSK